MKILLDENIPIQLKRTLPGNFEWFTVRELEWQGIKNGKLLKQMVEESFGALITMDKNLYNQQNLFGLNLILIIVRARDNKIETLQKAIPAIIEVLRTELNGVFEVGA